MAKYSQLGQWTLSKGDDTLLFKTKETHNEEKGELIKRKTIDPNGEEAKKIFEEFAKSIVRDTPRQPTNEELFGAGVPTEEQVQKAEHEWHNAFNLFNERGTKPVEDQDSVENRNWGNGSSFNDSLAPEELEKRKKHID